MRTYTKRGFTIIELIIAIAIIVLIAGIILVNYRVGQRQQTLQAEAQKLASILRQAQNMALAGKTYECETGKLEPQDYGVSLINEDTYQLFVDCNNDDHFSSIPIPPDIVLETIDLPQNITLGTDCVAFVFSRPRGDLAFSIDKHFRVTLAGNTKTITVNGTTGRISLE